MKAKVIMIVDGKEYEYGTYPFNTNNEKKRANEIAMKIRDERKVETFVEVEK